MKYLFALVLALASFASAQADSHDSMATTIPFDFVLGEKTFPAGTYTISRISDDPQEVSGFEARMEGQTYFSTS